jgi:hypothetical protein
MNVVQGANPTAKPPRWTAQMEPKVKAVCASWEAEVNFSYDLKPPNLLKVCNILESEKEIVKNYISKRERCQLIQHVIFTIKQGIQRTGRQKIVKYYVAFI